MRSVWTLCVALALVALAGCSTRTTCAACTKPPPQQQYACDVDMNKLDPSSPLLSPTPIDMLFLSGGGSHGAYGAGVLYSWSAGGAHAPPAVVTGVSAGALQSTWAFLGEPYNDAMYRNYTRLHDDEVYKTRPLLALLWSSSAATADGLQNIIDAAITDDVIRLVGKQDGKRLLCVGTVNLDTGRFVTWDMTAIAAADQFDLYRKVLRASASIPIVFPPVDIDDALYVDGGTRLEVFTAPLLTTIEMYRQTKYPTGNDHAHFLINLDLNVHPSCVDPSIKKIGKRTLLLVLAEGTYGSVSRSLVELYRHNLDERVEIDYRYIPSDFTVGFKSDKFDPALMCRLFCKGVSDGKQPWATELEDMPAPNQECTDIHVSGDAAPCVGNTPSCP